MVNVLSSSSYIIKWYTYTVCHGKWHFLVILFRQICAFGETTKRNCLWNTRRFPCTSISNAKWSDSGFFRFVVVSVVYSFHIWSKKTVSRAHECNFFPLCLHMCAGVGVCGVRCVLWRWHKNAYIINWCSAYISFTFARKLRIYLYILNLFRSCIIICWWMPIFRQNHIDNPFWCLIPFTNYSAHIRRALFFFIFFLHILTSHHRRLAQNKC